MLHIIKFRTNKKGFSLIELMVVVAITAILATIAIPSYKDYVNKAKVTTMLGLIEPCQLQVYQYFFKNGALPNGSTAGQTIVCQGITLPAGNPPTTPNLSDKVSAAFTYNAASNFFQFNINHLDLHPSSSTSSLYLLYVRLTVSNGDLNYSCGTSATTAQTLPSALKPVTCTGPNI